MVTTMPATVPRTKPRPGGRTQLDVAAVLFDMDGTLLDSAAAITTAWTRFAERNDLDVARVLRSVPGRTGPAIIAEHVTDPVHAARELDLLVREQEQLVDGIDPIPGARALLQSLPRHAWAVVTSAPLRVAARRLAAAGLPNPPVLVGAEDVRASKPDPEGFDLAARTLDAHLTDCLVVEDSAAGIQAGLRGNATVLRVGTDPDAAALSAHLDAPDLRVVHAQTTTDHRLTIRVRDGA
jgi:sugar-phosphatase